MNVNINQKVNKRMNEKWINVYMNDVPINKWNEFMNKWIHESMDIWWIKTF